MIRNEDPRAPLGNGRTPGENRLAAVFARRFRASFRSAAEAFSAGVRRPAAPPIRAASDFGFSAYPREKVRSEAPRARPALFPSPILLLKKTALWYH
ncbi:hypothetical protein CDO73_16735 [Saccharibacillus sp. O23]|nr:hypothetical protein CDO73_16735 [Saccharibacillus sp. O23]